MRAMNKILDTIGGLELCIVLLMALAILVIFALEFVALMNGINGTAYGLSMGAIGAIIVQAANLLHKRYKDKTDEPPIPKLIHTSTGQPHPNYTHEDNLQGWRK